MRRLSGLGGLGHAIQGVASIDSLGSLQGIRGRVSGTRLAVGSGLARVGLRSTALPSIPTTLLEAQSWNGLGMPATSLA